MLYSTSMNGGQRLQGLVYTVASPLQREWYSVGDVGHCSMHVAAMAGHLLVIGIAQGARRRLPGLADLQTSLKMYPFFAICWEESDLHITPLSRCKT